MKKRIVALFLGLVLILAGCGGDDLSRSEAEQLNYSVRIAVDDAVNEAFIATDFSGKSPVAKSPYTYNHPGGGFVVTITWTEEQGYTHLVYDIVFTNFTSFTGVTLNGTATIEWELYDFESDQIKWTYEASLSVGYQGNTYSVSWDYNWHITVVAVTGGYEMTIVAEGTYTIDGKTYTYNINQTTFVSEDEMYP